MKDGYNSEAMGPRWEFLVESIHLSEADNEPFPPFLDVEHRFRFPPPQIHEYPQALQYAVGG